ncbi:MAG: glycogen-binding domain-containing protein [Elusimicrobiota bacterium]
MKKKYWAMMMFFSLFLSLGSGAFVVNRINLKNSVQMAVKEVAVVQSQTIPVPALAVPSPATVQALPDSHTPIVKSDARNILFKFFKPLAKEVFIIGDFNKWFKEPMKKNGKIWEIQVNLTPGTYQYQFEVDGKKIKDPNNKISKNGRSVIIVKPN